MSELENLEEMFDFRTNPTIGPAKRKLAAKNIGRNILERISQRPKWKRQLTGVKAQKTRAGKP